MNTVNVINLKLTNACNYRCAYCFSKPDTQKTLSCNQWKQVVDNILSSVNVERINLLGGEPLLYSGIAELAAYIHTKGSKVSIITNGFNLTEQRIKLLKECGVSQIGLSIDSTSEETLRRLGRCNKKGEVLTIEKCMRLCGSIKNNGIALKINTVVNRLNYAEDISSLIKTVSPDRWKILKIKEYETDLGNNMDLLIDDKQFDLFIDSHKDIPHVAERTLSCSYIMIDNLGNLVDTGNYVNKPAASLFDTSFSDAFSRLDFDYDAYQARYAA